MRYIIYILVTIITFSSCAEKKKSISQMKVISMPDGNGIRKAEDFGLKLAIQSYTFHKFTLVEALKKTKELEIKYIEVYPGHKLGEHWGDKVFGIELSSEERLEIKEYAKQLGVKIVACGVYTTDDPSDWSMFFDFAKEMEMEYVTCEPRSTDLDIVESLAQKSNIKVGIHNHPQPSDYWNPKILLDYINNRPNLGACADLGHWRRESLDVIDCMNDLNRKIVSLHIKDVAPVELDDNDLEDCIWGNGVVDIDATLMELKKMEFDGYLAIEYEANWRNSIPDIKNCIFYYDLVTDRLF